MSVLRQDTLLRLILPTDLLSSGRMRTGATVDLSLKMIFMVSKFWLFRKAITNGPANNLKSGSGSVAWSICRYRWVHWPGQTEIAVRVWQN